MDTYEEYLRKRKERENSQTPEETGKIKSYDEYLVENDISSGKLQNDYLATISALQKVQSGWTDADTMKKTRADAEDVYDRVRNYIQTYLPNDSWTDDDRQKQKDLLSISEGLRTTLHNANGLKSYEDLYGRYSDADTYNAAMAFSKDYAADQEHSKSGDTDYFDAAIASLEKELEIANQNWSDAYLHEDKEKTRESAKELEDIRSRIAQKEQFRAEAEKASSAQNRENIANRWDYDKYAFDRPSVMSEEEIRAADLATRYEYVGTGKDGTAEFLDASGNRIDQSGVDRILAQRDAITRDKLGIFLQSRETESYGREYNTDDQDLYSQTVIEGNQKNWRFLNDNEISTYYYYLNSGHADAAYKYLEDMSYELGLREQEEQQKQMEGANALERILMNAASIPASVLGSVPAVIDDVVNMVQGKEVNPYDAAHRFTNFSKNIRTESAENISDWWSERGHEKIGEFASNAYQATMSALDSTFGSATMGSGYTTLMGLGAADQRAAELTAQGAENWQIVANSVLSGLTEWLSEKFSYDAITKLIDNSGIKLAHVIAALFGSAVEGLEEVHADLGNLLADALINGAKSENETKVRAYMAQGISEEEARKKVLIETIEQMAWSAFGGAISGAESYGTRLALVGTADTASAIRQARITNMFNQRTGENIISNNGVQALADLAAQTSNERAARKLGTLAGRDVSSMSDRERTRYARKVGKYASAVEQTERKAVTDKSKSAIRDEISKRVNEDESISAESKEAVTEAILHAMTADKVSANDQKVIAENQEAADRVYEAVSNSEQLAREIEKSAPEETKRIRATETLSKKKRPTYEEFASTSNGKTLLTQNGSTEEVTVRKISDAAEGTVELDDGRIVKASDVSYGSADEAVRYQSALNIAETADGANAIVNILRSGNVTDTASLNDALLAYGYGLTNQKSELARLNISEEMRNQLFAAGRVDADARAQSKDAGAYIRGKIGRGKGVKWESKKHIDDLNETQKATVTVANALAESSPLDIHIFESYKRDGVNYAFINGKEVKTNANGWFVEGTNRIYIDLNAGNDYSGLGLFTLSHEISHYVRAWNAQGWKKLADLVVTEIDRQASEDTSKKSFNEMLNEKFARYTMERKSGNRDYVGRSDKALRDMAYEDVVCDAMSSMMAEKETFTKFMNAVKAKDQTLWEKIKTAIKEFLDNIDNAIKSFAGLSAEQESGRAIQDAASEIKEQIRDLFVAAFAEANDRFKRIKGTRMVRTNGLAVDESIAPIVSSSKYKKPSDPLNVFSYRTFEAWKDYYKKEYGDTEENRAIINYVEDFTNRMIQEDAVKAFVPMGLYKYTKTGPIRKNQEYIITFDMDTTCPRTFQFNHIRDIIKRRIGRPLTDKESFNLLELMRAYGQQIPCSYCYVENKRVLLSASYNNYLAYMNLIKNTEKYDDAEKLIYGYKEGKELPDASRETLDRWWGEKDYNPTVDQVWMETATARNSVINFLDELAEKGTIKFKKTGAISTGQKRIEDIVCKRFGINDENAQKEISGFVSQWVYDRMSGNEYYTEVKNDFKIHDIDQRALTLNHYALAYAKSASSAKSVENYMPYTDQIRYLDKDKIKNINAMGGVRKHSSNDFRIDYVQDYFMFFADLAAKGLYGHTYTKSVDYVKIFGRTGDRINMSIAFYGDSAETLRENVYEGMAHADARELREAYKENAGVMAMVTNDYQLTYALNANWIDMIIPFHASSLNKDVIDLRGWLDYTSKQTERWLASADMISELKEHGIEVPKGANADEIAALYEGSFEQMYGKPMKKVYEITSKGERVLKKPHFLPGEQVLKGTGDIIPGHNNDVNRYFELCREYGVKPRFKGITVETEDGKKVDITEHPGYIKVLKETSKIGGQEAIKFNFDQKDDYLGMSPFEYAMKALEEQAKLGGFENIKTTDFNSLIVEDFMKNYAGKNREIGYLSPTAESYQKLRDNEQADIDEDELADAIAALKEEARLNRGTKAKFSDEFPSDQRRNSDRDSEGNTLSEGQREFFKDSKVRDEDGNLMVVYHGTYDNFTVFDPQKGRSAADIQGMFFSPWEIDAGGYGPNLGSYYINIKNPADERTAYKALNLFKGKNEAGKKAREYLISKGYDGVINGVDGQPEEFIAFYPNQIKRIDNKNPTENDDIRYSGRGNGYDGYSMSNNARSAYEDGEKPLSKWTKAEIINAVRDINPILADKLKVVGSDALRSHLLVYTSWHHTSSMYNRTDFYSIDEDALNDITDDTIAKWANEKKSTPPVKKYKGDIEYIEWEGTRNHPRAIHKNLTDVNIEERGSFYIITDDGGKEILRKKIGSNGTRVTNYAERDAENARREEIENAYRANSSAKAYEYYKSMGAKSYSQSGHIYKEGRKPSSYDYANGLENFFVKGEHRIYDDPINHRYILETWDGKQFVKEKIDESQIFSDRDEIDARQVLADSLQTTVQTDAEFNMLQQYIVNIDMLNQQEARLADINEQLKKLSFTKGKRDTAKITALQDEKTKITNRLKIYDSRLLRLEASAPLKNLLKREKDAAKKKGIEQTTEKFRKLMHETVERERALAADRQRQRIADLRQSYQEAHAKSIQDLKDRYAEQRQRAVDRHDRTEMRNRVIEKIDKLNSLLMEDSDKHHVPQSMKGFVATALEMFNTDTVQAEREFNGYTDQNGEYHKGLNQRIKEAKTDEEREKLIQQAARLQKRDYKAQEKLAQLRAEYERIAKDPDASTVYFEEIGDKIELLSEEVKDLPIKDMTLYQLQELDEIFSMILGAISNANKAFAENLKATTEELGTAAIDEIETEGGTRDKFSSVETNIRKYDYLNKKPIYFFRMLGSPTMQKLFNNILEAQGTWYQDAVVEGASFAKETMKKYGYYDIDMEKKYKFTSKNGKEFELTAGQMMSIYAHSKRKQSMRHLTIGGFVFDSMFEEKKDVELNGVKTKLKMKYFLNPGRAITLSKENVEEIVTKLRGIKGAIDFVDEMQDYLSIDMAAKGNEVSMKLWNIKAFGKERYYFPIVSAGEFMERKNEPTGMTAIRRPGFSKQTTPNANNPMILGDFMQTWSNHVDSMSMYHAFTLPIEDFRRVYNWRTPAASEDEGSVKSAIGSAYSKSANAYIDQLFMDLAGGVKAAPGADGFSKRLAIFKKGATMASASVVIQQPSSIVRAMAYINPKYFVGDALVFDINKHEEDWNEMKRLTSTAGIKEMGYFDTDMGRSFYDVVISRDSKDFTLAENKDRFIHDEKYRDDVLSKAPAFADELAWVSMWRATKKWVSDTTKLKGDEYLKEVARRFDEVINLTQVYDSILSRSGFMRSKDALVKMSTSFMAEPTVTENMAEDAILQYRRNKIGKEEFGKIFTSLVANAVVTAILHSLVTAWRDTPKKPYGEAYLERLLGDVKDNLNPLSYLPVVKDIYETIQGYTVERTDMAVYADIVNSFEAITSEKKSAYEKIAGILGSISAFFGIPLKNIERDIRPIIARIIRIFDF